MNTENHVKEPTVKARRPVTVARIERIISRSRLVKQSQMNSEKNRGLYHFVRDKKDLSDRVLSKLLYELLNIEGVRHYVSHVDNLTAHTEEAGLLPQAFFVITNLFQSTPTNLPCPPVSLITYHHDLLYNPLVITVST